MVLHGGTGVCGPSALRSGSRNFEVALMYSYNGERPWSSL